jgi:hypothetical protein
MVEAEVEEVERLPREEMACAKAQLKIEINSAVSS